MQRSHEESFTLLQHSRIRAHAGKSDVAELLLHVHIAERAHVGIELLRVAVKPQDAPVQRLGLLETRHWKTGTGNGQDEREDSSDVLGRADTHPRTALPRTSYMSGAGRAG